MQLSPTENPAVTSSTNRKTDKNKADGRDNETEDKVNES